MTFSTNFKSATPAKVTRAKQRTERKRLEDRHKAIVRKRDKRCRFPLCGCQRYKLACEVGHLVHKGMGGNPAGDRSTPSGMVYLCQHRHRRSRISIHAGTLRIEPLTDRGADGPLKWAVDGTSLPERVGTSGWVEVGRETAVGVLVPVSRSQRAILTELAKMTR